MVSFANIHMHKHKHVQVHTDAHEGYNTSTPLLHKGKLIFTTENALWSEGIAMH